MNQKLECRSHIALDTRLRSKKTRKIEYLLSSKCNRSGENILEVGTNPDIITSHFIKITGLFGNAHAVSAIDQRQNDDEFSFGLIKVTCLPLEDASFF